MDKITPFLWFDSEAEEAAGFYVSIFPNSKLGEVTRYSVDAPQKKAGDVMTVSFQLDGRDYTALNGGPMFKFTEAVSFSISCADQAEVDHLWSKLTEGGEPGPCGWLKDRFGLSWQVVPRALYPLLNGPDKAGAQRTFDAMMKMGKLDVVALEAAYRG